MGGAPEITVNSMAKGVTKMASLSEGASFAVMLAQSGMHVPEEQWPSLLEGYRHILRLLADEA